MVLDLSPQQFWRFALTSEACAIPMRKLTEQDVRAIRDAAGTASQSELGRRFGVNQTTIGEIIHRRSWVNAA